MESHSPRWHSIDECFVFLKWPVRILAYTMRSKTTKRGMHVFCLTGLRGSCGIRSMRSYLLEMGYLDFAICDSARNGADRNIMRLTMRVKFNGSIWWRELYFLITDDSNLATNDLTGNCLIGNLCLSSKVIRGSPERPEVYKPTAISWPPESWLSFWILT